MRTALIASCRKEIEAGRMDSPERTEVAVDKMIDEQVPQTSDGRPIHVDSLVWIRCLIGPIVGVAVEVHSDRIRLGGDYWVSPRQCYGTREAARAADRPTVTD